MDISFFYRPDKAFKGESGFFTGHLKLCSFKPYKPLDPGDKNSFC